MKYKYVVVILIVAVLVFGVLVYASKHWKWFAPREQQQEQQRQQQQDQGTKPLDSLVHVTNPGANQIVASPLLVTGEARGSWYFEASFPVKLLDANGKVLAQAPAQAQGDWMTDNFVPFKVSLNFANPITDTGILILEKDNPSGRPESASEVTVPVHFQVQKQNIKLYYYNSNKDKDTSGNVLCSRLGLTAVDRQIPVSITPIQDSIKLLLQGNLTEAEKASGISTEFPLPGVTLVGAASKSGVLTLEFADPQNKTSGGSCRASVLWFQIEATAKQFPGVSQVKYKPNTLFQP